MSKHLVDSDLRRDKFGRYLLTDIYNLAKNKGVKDPLKPLEFLNSSAMKLYEQKLERHIGRKAVAGSAGGYYVEEIIALKYANQLSHTLEVELHQTFQNNCKEDPTMPEIIESEMSAVDSFPEQSSVRVSGILSAIRMANDILSNTAGIDALSCSQCTLTLLEVNLGVDLSAAKSLLVTPVKLEPVQVLEENPPVETPAAIVATNGSSLAAQSAEEVGSPFTLLPMDLSKQLGVSQGNINKALFDLGLQTRVANGTWRPTESAEGVGAMVKLGAKGGYNRRLMWHPEMVTVLKDHFTNHPIKKK